MNRISSSLSVGIFLIVGIISGLAAQTVEVREIIIKKNRPDEIYYKAAAAVTLWIQDDHGSFERIIMEHSRVDIFEDNLGLNLIKAHGEAIISWEHKVKELAKQNRYVSMSRSHYLLSAEGLDEDEGVSGFYLTLESWALPSKGSSSLHLSGIITYVVALEEQSEETFSELFPVETKNIHIGDYEIEFSDISTNNGMVGFTLYSELPVTDVIFYNSEGEQVSDFLYSMNGNPVMEMPEEYYNSHVSLTIFYKKTMTQSVVFDENVGLGF